MGSEESGVGGLEGGELFEGAVADDAQQGHQALEARGERLAVERLRTREQA